MPQTALQIMLKLGLKTSHSFIYECTTQLYSIVNYSEYHEHCCRVEISLLQCSATDGGDAECCQVFKAHAKPKG